MRSGSRLGRTSSHRRSSESSLPPSRPMSIGGARRGVIPCSELMDERGEAESSPAAKPGGVDPSSESGAKPREAAGDAFVGEEHPAHASGAEALPALLGAAPGALSRSRYARSCRTCKEKEREGL